MKEEMRFLKYRRDVVSAWPESPRKTVFLSAIESRMKNLEPPPPKPSVGPTGLPVAA